MRIKADYVDGDHIKELKEKLKDMASEINQKRNAYDMHQGERVMDKFSKNEKTVTEDDEDEVEDFGF